MSKIDQLHRYLFEQQAVRGELVNVSQTYKEMMKNHTYPQPVQHLLGEMLVATSLLTAILKFDGEMVVQLQGDGPLSLAVISSNNHLEMRGIARVNGEIPDNSSLKEMIGNGALVITITPSQGERYQGVVGIEGDTIGQCLEAYFMQSEQLPTRIFIRTDAKTQQAAGILLQVLPAQERDADSFDHLSILTDTIKAEELFELDAKEILHRLYHEEDVVVFEGQKVIFKCRCSRERCLDSLMSIQKDELDTILREDGEINMNCEFCGTDYHFDAVDIEAARAGAEQASDSDEKTLH